MPSKVLVLGGTRYFGRLMVDRLVEAGAAVTVATRGRASRPASHSVRHRQLDRLDPAALHELAADGYDVVIDQLCYSPIAARMALDAFKGRIGRYVMTSTIEVYNPGSFSQRPAICSADQASEADLELGSYPIELHRPWLEESFIASHYGEGKRQAEACLLQSAPFPVVTVRVGHVLALDGDFTARLERLVRAAASATSLSLHSNPGPTSFIRAEEIAEFMAWAAASAFTGPVNAASSSPVSADWIASLAASAAGRELVRKVPETGEAGPFSYPAPFSMSVERAKALGFVFSDSRSWLPHLVQSLTQRVLAEAPARVPL